LNSKFQVSIDLRAADKYGPLALRHVTLVYTFIIAAPLPMSTTPSEIWNKILKDDVKKDDPLWREYLDKAAVFDARMVDEWNKIVDVLLVYVGCFLLISSREIRLLIIELSIGCAFHFRLKLFYRPKLYSFPTQSGQYH
jgi:hypothetical protein